MPGLAERDGFSENRPLIAELIKPVSTKACAGAEIEPPGN
jgi:hypothetical protein